MTVDVEVKVEYDFSNFNDLIGTAMSRGLNRGVERSKGEAKRRITKQNSLVNGAYKAIKTNPNALEAKMVVSDSPVDLASYAMTSPSQARAEGGVRFRVKPGKIAFMKGAFFMKTKHGLVLTRRLKPGQRLPNRKKAKFASKSGLVFGLWGPSADQMFIPGHADHNTGIASEMAGWSADVSVQEFFRQLDLGLRKSKK